MAPDAGPSVDGVLDAARIPAYFSTRRHRFGQPVVAIYTASGGGVRAGCFLYVEPGVELMIGGNHRMDWVTTFPVREIYDLPGARVGIPWSKGDIVIGHGVRLGRGAKVMSGVKIGDGARVVPYSVVVGDVRPYSVVAGSPAREVGSRFDADIVDRMARSAWWDWHDDMTIWRLDRLTRGQAHELVPQLGRVGPMRRPAPLRRWAAHILRGVAHRLDVDEEAAAAPAAPPSVVAAAQDRAPEATTGPATPAAAGAGPTTPGGPLWPTPTEPPPAALSDRSPGAPNEPPPAALSDRPPMVAMGRGSYGWPAVHGPLDRVTIGNYCSIAPGSAIVTEGHDDPAPSKSLGRRLRRGALTTGASASVRLGNDVWVGRGASILPGVTIGDGAVVAAYAVVMSDVRPYAVVAGNPACEMKRRFDDKTVDALLRIRWWEWSEDVVQQRAEDLCSEDLPAFVARYDPRPAAFGPEAACSIVQDS